MFLSIKDITVYYGKSMAIEGVSLEVAEGSVVSVIGANGAGKSTILRGLFGLVPLTSGEIRFKEAEITGGRTVDIVKRGIGLVPEGRQLFPYLSVQSNLKLGASLIKDKGEINSRLEEVYGLFPRLEERSATRRSGSSWRSASRPRATRRHKFPPPRSTAGGAQSSFFASSAPSSPSSSGGAT